MDKRIVIGADHGGFNMKKALIAHLEENGWNVADAGTDSAQSCDYPVYARKVCEAVLEQGCPGILVCGTGLGMSMAANRIPGIRAAVCANAFLASKARTHNNANVLCLGERVTGPGLASAIVDAFLDNEFEGDRHQRRIDMFEHMQD